MADNMGSMLRNRTAAGTCSSFGTSRSASAWLTTVAPIQTFGSGALPRSRQRLPSASRIMSAALPMRFVSSSQSRCGVSWIKANRSDLHSSGTWLSNTSARLAQNTRKRRPSRPACAFQRSGCCQFAGLVRLRGAPGPQLIATPPPKRALRVSA